MNLTIISGSHRTNSNSFKVAAFIQKTVTAEGMAESAEIISLARNPLPMWDEDVFSGSEPWQQALGPVRARLRASDALVIVAPEWHGQIPPGLKNLLMLVDQGDVGHKPCLIVTVSAGISGAYPVTELRAFGGKNNRICFIPEQIIVRGADRVLNEDSAENDTEQDAMYRSRIPWALNILKAYAEALAVVRASGVTQTDAFHNGM